jgi:hypothetical protein
VNIGPPHEREHQSHIKMGTYEIINASDMPLGAKLLGIKEVFKLKVGSDGKPISYKARTTIQGCGQRPFAEYRDTTAHVVKYRSLRVLCAMVAAEDLEFKQFDVETAFLHGDLKEELYARPPPDTPDIKPGQVLKLLKTIYGLKQASHAWGVKLNAAIKRLGYSQLASDECIWVKRSKTGKLMIIATYVDDVPRAYSKADEAEMERDMAQLRAQFTIKDMGDVEYIVGWRITRDRSKRTLTIDQSGYITGLLEQYNMEQCKPDLTPGTMRELLYAEDGSLLDTARKTEYASLIGALQYPANSCRPDIQQAVNALGALNGKPKPVHFAAGMRILRYLAGTKNNGITYTGAKGAMIIDASCDSDWASDPQDRKSITGYVVKLAGAAVSWCSRKQPTVSQRTQEAEYIAAAETAKELVWLRLLLFELGFMQEGATLLKMDNTAAIASANGTGSV